MCRPQQCRLNREDEDDQRRVRVSQAGPLQPPKSANDVFTKQHAAFVSEMAAMGLKVAPMTPNAVRPLYRVCGRSMKGVMVYINELEIFHEDGTPLPRAGLLWLAEMTKGEAKDSAGQRRGAREKEKAGQQRRQEQRMDERELSRKEAKELVKDRIRMEKEMKRAREKEEKVEKRMREKANHERRLSGYLQDKAWKEMQPGARSKAESRALARRADARDKEMRTQMREVQTCAC